VAALFDSMMTVFTIISAITFCHYSGIILGEVIAFFAITNGKAPSLFNIMAAIFTGIIRASQGKFLSF
jgi:general stress protein CsbA